nr:MAG TPA: hypothetical protein [Bacteriophage sp.]
MKNSQFSCRLNFFNILQTLILRCFLSFTNVN